MRSYVLPVGIGLLLALLMLPSLTAASVELVWESDNAKISVTIHRYRPSSTSGWATEELATLIHNASRSTGYVIATMDFSCNIEGFVNAEGGSLDVASMIHQQYGTWFRGVRVAQVSISADDFEALFSAHTFTMDTHVDNTWTLDAWLSANASSSASVYALRMYQHFKTHGTPDEGDDTMDDQYYALIDAVLSGGDVKAFLGSGWFPDSRNSVWWGNETLAFQFSADDIDAYIEAVEFPIVNVYMDVDELIGEAVRPR